MGKDSKKTKNVLSLVAKNWTFPAFWKREKILIPQHTYTLFCLEIDLYRTREGKNTTTAISFLNFSVSPKVVAHELSTLQIEGLRLFIKMGHSRHLFAFSYFQHIVYTVDSK